MVGFDENALICDFAEVYHIYDYKSLPPSRAAIFACGLREDSRIRMRMEGRKTNLTQTLIAGMIDLLTACAYASAGMQGEPPPVMDQLFGTAKPLREKSAPASGSIVGYSTGEELREQLKKMRGEGGCPEQT